MLIATALADTGGSWDDTGSPDTGETCGLELVDTVPSSRFPVPIDADIVVFLAGGLAGETASIQLYDRSTVYAAITWTSDGGPLHAIPIDPPADLPPNTNLILAISDSCRPNRVQEVHLATSAARAAPVGDVEVWEAAAAWKDGESRILVRPRAPDPDHVGWFEVTALGTTVPAIEYAWITRADADPPERICASVVRVDGTGGVAPPIEVCPAIEVEEEEDDEDEGGCGGRASTGLLLAGGLALAGRRR